MVTQHRPKDHRKDLRMSPIQEPSNATGRTWLQNVRDLVAIVGGVTAIVAALLWILGRQYVRGYFTAVNIPVFQVNLTLWDYAEAAWLFLIMWILLFGASIGVWYFLGQYVADSYNQRPLVGSNSVTLYCLFGLC